MSMINEFVEKLIEKIKFEIEASNINDDYTTGLRNGMRYCLSLIDGKKPEFESCKQGWIPCEERFPDKEEYLKDDGRFIVTDGNRRYQCIYDIYQGSFRSLVLFTNSGIERGWNFEEDKCVIAWQPLPEPYKGE